MRTCHGCHAPVDEDHKGSMTGAKQCPFDHWDGCQGGIDVSSKDWRPCPPNFVPVLQTETDEDSENSEDDKLDTATAEDSYLLETAEAGQITQVEGHHGNLQHSPLVDEHSPLVDPLLGSQASLKEKVGHTDHVTVEEVGTDEDEDDERVFQELEAANKLLKAQLAKQELERAEQSKRERKRKIEMLKAENARMSQNMGGDTGGAKPKTAALPSITIPDRPGVKLMPHPKSLKSRPAAKISSVPQSVTRHVSTTGSSWQPAFQDHLSRNQSRAAHYRPTEAPIYQGMDINGIRRMPTVGTDVESLLGKIQNQVPSLDEQPTLTPGQPLPPPRSKNVSKVASAQQHGVVDDGITVEEEFVYQKGHDGTLKKVRVVSTIPMRQSPAGYTPQGQLGGYASHSAPVPDSDPDTSSDEDCDIVPQPGYHLRWKRDSAGEKYNIEERAQERSPEMVYKYVKDASGRSYKKLVPREEKDLVYKWVVDPATGQRVQMLTLSKPSTTQKLPKQQKRVVGTPNQYIDHRTSLSTAHSAEVHAQSGVRNPRLVSTSNFVSSAVTAEEKQGKGNVSDIVKTARDCPIAWTTKVTGDKLNMGLWCWSYMAQLLQTRTGQAPSLGQGELEARMQHFLNVLEIALQPSNPTEFDGHSWRVARLYADKIQHKVDRGETWTKFEEKYGTDSQPSELMAAREELGPKQVKKSAGNDPYKGTDKNEKRVPKRTCTTWNTSSIEGKCDWESQNEGRACDRRHECSWCKEKGKKSLHHQRSFCKQRIAAGDQ